MAQVAQWSGRGFPGRIQVASFLPPRSRRKAVFLLVFHGLAAQYFVYGIQKDIPRSTVAQFVAIKLTGFNHSRDCLSARFQVPSNPRRVLSRAEKQRQLHGLWIWAL